MKQSENITDLLSELVDIQCEMPSFPKTKQAYGYKYTDLDTITAALKPLLHKHNIAYLQSVGGGNTGTITLTTRVFNKGGQFIEDTVELPEINGEKTKINAAQTIGMSITYMRRYALCALFGITSDEDVDAQVFERNVQQQAKAEQKAAQSAPKTETIYADGKPATDEQKKRLHELCAAKYNSGQAVFAKDEMQLYLAKSKEMSAQDLIVFIENALRNRRADAPELPENKVQK